MNIVSLIDSIPKLFTYFIPGYISLVIINYYSSTKKKDEKYLVIMPITLSFIITNVMDLFLSLFFYKSNQNIKSISYLVGSVILGISVSLYNNDKIKVKVKPKNSDENKKESISLKKIIDRKITNNYSSEPTVWFKAMKSEKGQWVRVFLYEDNIAYIGSLDYYTRDTEVEEKEILLSKYVSLNIKQNKIIESTESYEDKVWINCKNITCIEFLKGEECDNINKNEENTD